MNNSLTDIQLGDIFASVDEVDQDEIKDLTQKALYSIKLEDSLFEFVKESWEYVVQDEYKDRELTKIICDHLQGMYEGKIPSNRLCISIPPGFGKSILTCVFFPAWIWTKDPTYRILTGSYNLDFATRDARRTRDLIKSPWYQHLWGHKFKFAGDQDKKSNYENTKKGYRFVFGVGSSFTGTRADIIIVDDSIKAQKQFVYSEPVRKVANGLVGNLDTRLANQITGKIILVGQRLHVDDSVGNALKKKMAGWEYLSLPLNCDKSILCKTTLFEDKRESDESLDPEGFPPEVVARLKEGMGSKDYNAQYQQKPENITGSIILRDWFRYYLEAPHRFYRIQSWDMAFTDKTQNDRCCCTTWDVCSNGYYLIDLFIEGMTFHTMEEKAKSLFAKYNPNKVIIENKASGISLIQEFKRTTRIPVEAINVSTSKEIRVITASPLFESEKILFPRGKEWLSDLEDELVDFPNVTHDDRTDSVSMAIIYMTQQIRKPGFIAL